MSFERVTCGLLFCGCLVIGGGLATAQPAPPAGPTRPAAVQAADAQGRIVAMQGQVEHTPAREDRWGPAQIQQPLFVDERVRTLTASRAAVLFIDETQVKLNAGAVLTVQQVRRPGGGSTTLQLLKGEGWFRTKNPASGLTIQTPAAAAAIRGTEINLQVRDDEESVLTVVEGSVEFFNDFGRVTAVAGEGASARPGQAPVKRVVLNPEDAVQWALYYPVDVAWRQWPAAGQGGAGAAGYQRLAARDPVGALQAFEPAVGADPWASIGVAIARAQLGQYAEATAALDRMGADAALPAELQAERQLQRAALALAAGDVPGARASLERALAPDRTAVRPLTLLSAVELVQNRKDAARAAADAALAAHPDAIPALIAASEAAQAAFDLERARALLDRALAVDPDDTRALVNRARLRFGTDDTRGALADIRRAMSRAPGDPQALSLSGFIRLSQGDATGATADLRQAAAADATFGEPHLGLGLALFKQERVQEGLDEMLTATLLEPKVALYQSYLGKAYYQAHRFPEGLAALETAKRLDPRDPTPWLYASYFMRDQNRQVDALAQVRQAIALNDNRAVYRSRMLLDRDEATRTVSLAELYRQLGFEAWGAYEAQNSLDADMTNASAHLFLADTYGALPDRTQALGSELLQYFLYAPVNRNAFASFAEYTALLEQPFYELRGEGGLGEPGRTLATAVTRSGNDRFAHYAFLEHRTENGARPDQDDTRLQGFAQAKVSFTERTDIFLSWSGVNNDLGEDRETVRTFGSDLQSAIILRQFDSNRDPNRTTLFDSYEAVVGVKHAWRAGSAFTAATRWDQTTNTETDPDGTVSACTGFPVSAIGLLTNRRLEFPSSSVDLQAQQATRLGRHQVIGGAQAFGQRKERNCSETIYYADTGLPFTTFKTSRSVRDHTYRGYLRDEIEVTRWLHATIGTAYDDVRYADPSETGRTFDIARWSPLAGVAVRLGPQTMLRIAAFKNLNSDFIGTKISPLTVSGFVQERNEFPTAVRKEGGVSLEHGTGRLFLGGRFYTRDTVVPLFMDSSDFVPEADETARGGTAYANWALTRRFTLFGEDVFSRTQTSSFWRDDNLARVGLSLVHEMGLIARISTGYTTQRFSRASVELPNSSFPLTDAQVTYEFAGKRGLFTLIVSNLFDRSFNAVVEGVAVEQPQPVRRALASLRWRL